MEIPLSIFIHGLSTVLRTAITVAESGDFGFVRFIIEGNFLIFLYLPTRYEIESTVCIWDNNTVRVAGMINQHTRFIDNDVIAI